MLIEPKALRSALGRFATGVTIITCRDAAGQPVGLTANSFNSLSLDPPLVMWALRNASSHLIDFQKATHFAVNVLAEDQIGLSRRFASPVPDRFAEGTWTDGQGGVPVLANCTAVFECHSDRHHAAGDHVLFIGRVLALHQADLPPLLFHAGNYHQRGAAL
ncbi:flavin reductase family protein [Ideonella margarita]|jgi:flavin reductase (DIM6/NTAB) family NADH-FMN oxidoreductase RutF|uniref:Flavin reductase family protein n=1 Tax=Ideonella margarita TaxID=2984191 RepID=A0ABU9CDC5_9BURK